MKTIGDAAMLVSPEVEPLVEATISLVVAAEVPRSRLQAAGGESDDD